MGTGKDKDEGVLLGTVKAVEELWVAVLQQAVASKGLLGLSGRWLSLGLKAKEASEAWAEQLLRHWGVPSAAQMREALGLLQRVEERLLRLEDRLEELAAPRQTPAGAGAGVPSAAAGTCTVVPLAGAAAADAPATDAQAAATAPAPASGGGGR
ncbi:MAG: hypothetical protein FJ125_16440 [Deltaproteobacteria bacterium]|nr:hypothetical protein [Deltaproteobacteria bacterium]